MVTLTFGFPRMYNEPGERRAFLPSLMTVLGELGAEVFVEAGSGTGMGIGDEAYLAASPRVRVCDEARPLPQIEAEQRRKPRRRKR